MCLTEQLKYRLAWKGGYRVGIRSSQGGYFYYAHLSSYSDIKKGDKIKNDKKLKPMKNVAKRPQGKYGEEKPINAYALCKNKNQERKVGFT